MARQLKLPIHDVIDDVVQSLRNHPNLVLQVDTGAGKTTVVPLALLEDEVVQGKIYVLQPRRMAAVASARRMAKLCKEAVGETVGYRVRYENVVSGKTRVEVLTAGILVRLLHNNVCLEGVGAVVLDEFHERSTDLDMALALCRGLQIKRRPELRIVVMSATLSALGDKLCHRLGDCPRIFHSGREFPIEIKNVKWKRTGEAQILEKKVAELVRSALQNDSGDILVFLPGRKEIWTVLTMLNNSYGIGDGRIHRGLPAGLKLTAVATGPKNAIPVLPLHGSLTPEEQEEAMAPSADGKRKVILATPIAESSVTIPGVRTVIDSGKRQIKQYCLKSNTTVMQTVEISRASAEQRAGRSGRTGPGTCYRMLEDGEERWDDNGQSEIVREDLCSAILELVTIGVCTDDEIASLPWIDCPSHESVIRCRELLSRMKACKISADHGTLLPRGRDLGRLPSHPRLAHVVLQAFMLWGRASAREACDFTALLEEKEAVSYASSKDLSPPKVLEGGRVTYGIDLQPRYLALRDEKAQGVDAFVQERVHRVSDQLVGLLGLAADRHDEREPLDPRCVSLMVAWAFPEFVAKRIKDWVERPTGPVVGFKMANGAEVYVDVNDPLGASPWLAIAELRRDRVIWACAADPVYLKECGMDVRDPVNHEVFAGDLSRMLREPFKAAACFMEAEMINPAEVRIDPCSGKKTTFGALRLQAGDEGIIELKHFWHYECRMPGAPGAAQQRIDPADGKALTLVQFQEQAAHRFCDATELELYWEQCPPLQRRGKLLEKEDLLVVRSGAKSQGHDARQRGNAEVKGVEQESSPGGDTRMEDVIPKPKKKAKKPAPPLKAWPMWPRRLLQNQVDSSLEEWLHSIDGRGALCEYHMSIADSYDSTTQILDLYTKVHEDETKEWLGNEFFEDIGILKIGHRKLFSRWFNDSLTLIGEAKPATDLAQRAGFSEEQPSQALQAAEEVLEEWD